jgi:hypothetical protein
MCRDEYPVGGVDYSKRLYAGDRGGYLAVSSVVPN